jgi:membrane fusion protein (multidrug efflux system)
MAARVDFLADTSQAEATAPRRVFVPAAAVRDEAGQAVVWVVRDGHLARTPVDAGPVSGGRREIRAGLSGGEQVMTEGPATLEDGAAVRIKTP